MAEQKIYHLRVRETLIEVPKAVYLAYYRPARYAKHLREKDERHGLVRYSAMDTDAMLGEEGIVDVSAPTVEDAAIHNVMCEKLRRSLPRLTETEREVLQAIYFKGLTERQAARQMGIHYMTVHDYKVRALRKLKKLLENQK